MNKPEIILEINYVEGKEVFTKYSKKVTKKKKRYFKSLEQFIMREIVFFALWKRSLPFSSIKVGHVLFVIFLFLFLFDNELYSFPCDLEHKVSYMWDVAEILTVLNRDYPSNVGLISLK